MLMEAIENTKCSNPDRELVIGLFLGEVVMLGHTLDTDRLMSAITAALENPHLSLEKYNQIQSDLYLN
jgi:hypothetical protein